MQCLERWVQICYCTPLFESVPSPPPGYWPDALRSEEDLAIFFI